MEKKQKDKIQKKIWHQITKSKLIRNNIKDLKIKIRLKHASTFTCEHI